MPNVFGAVNDVSIWILDSIGIWWIVLRTQARGAAANNPSTHAFNSRRQLTNRTVSSAPIFDDKTYINLESSLSPVLPLSEE